MRRTARTAAYAVAPATNSEPATSQETSDGLAVNWFAGTVTYSAWLDRRMENPITSSPTAKPLTPEPISATTPARSLPCPDGNVAGNTWRTAPERIAASLILMPAARTSTRTSPAPETGRGTSRTSRTSRPPYESNRTAFMNAGRSALGHGRRDRRREVGHDSHLDEHGVDHHVAVEHLDLAVPQVPQVDT